MEASSFIYDITNLQIHMCTDWPNLLLEVTMVYSKIKDFTVADSKFFYGTTFISVMTKQIYHHACLNNSGNNETIIVVKLSLLIFHCA